MNAAEPPSLRKRGFLRGPYLLIFSMLMSLTGFMCGLLLYPNAVSILSVVLLSFALAPITEALLNQNRDQIWKENIAPSKANLKLAAGFATIFAGIFITFFLGVMIAEDSFIEIWFEWQLERLPAASVAEMEFGELPDILDRNIIVAMGALLAALIYRHGGVILVLAWNASTWGAVFSCVIRMASESLEESLITYSLQTMVCIFPHLVTEAVGYILIAMAGVFLSRAVTRYSFQSNAFLQVGGAVLNILIAGFLMLLLGAALEAFWAPRAIQFMF